MIRHGIRHSIAISFGVVEKLFLAIVCLLACSADKTRNAAEANKKVQPQNGEVVFVLAQESSSLGKQITYVSPHYLRMESKRTGCTFLVKPPGAQMEIINDAKKVYFEADVSNWRDKGPKATSDLQTKYKEFLNGRALEQGTICGLVAYRYTKRVSKKKEVDYWLARDIAISPATRDLLSKTIGSEVPLDRMPLRILSREQKKTKVKTKNYLDTTEFKKMTVNAAIFSRPNSYAQAANEIDVLADFDDSELEGISSIIYKYNETGSLPGKQELNNLKSKILNKDR